MDEDEQPDEEDRPPLFRLEATGANGSTEVSTTFRFFAAAAQTLRIMPDGLFRQQGYRRNL